MTLTILSNATFLLSFLLSLRPVDASWRMFANTLVSSRVDPLIAPGRVSAHVHDYVGGNNFGVTYDYNDQRGSSCSSIEIQSDLSGYWAPAVYYKGRDGSFTLLSSSYVVYYLHRGSNQVAFPEGFRMIAGSAVKNTLNPDSIPDQAINFHCLGTDLDETLEFPNQHCPGGVRVQIMFPSCWNGRDVTSTNFKDHVAYPTDGKEGRDCPSSHPVRLITLFLEHVIDTRDIDWYPGCLVLSNGDNKGWSSHADFTNGWDTNFLQQAINECTDPFANLASCGLLMQTQNGDLARQCQPNKYLPLEDVGFYGPISKLLGDNPVWGGGVAKVTSGGSNTPPLVAPWSVVTDGWQEHGCINEGDPYTNTMTGDHWVDQSMNPQNCVTHCDSLGFSMAGLASGDTCFCANQLEHNGSMNLVDMGKCQMRCAGSHYEWCGGGRNLRVWTKTNAASTFGDYDFPPAGARLSQVYSSDGSSVPVVDGPSPSTPTNGNSSSNGGGDDDGNIGSNDDSSPGSVPFGPDNPPLCPPRRQKVVQRDVVGNSKRQLEDEAFRAKRHLLHSRHRRFAWSHGH